MFLFNLVIQHLKGVGVGVGLGGGVRDGGAMQVNLKSSEYYRLWDGAEAEEITVFICVFLKSKSRITISSAVFMITEVFIWPLWFVAAKSQCVCCEFRRTRLIHLRR